MNVCRVVLLACLAWTTVAAAGEYNQVLSVGDAAPAWKDLPGVDGKQHSLADFKDKPVVLVTFTCNSCPVAQDYEERIIAVAKKYAPAGGKVGMVAINVNKIEADSLEKMKERAESRGFTFPYLFDETQKIAKDFGATHTPEFFVLDKDRKIVYMGGMDDSSKADRVKTNYLDAAIDAALAGGQPKISETTAIGCSIRYERQRKAKP